MIERGENSLGQAAIQACHFYIDDFLPGIESGEITNANGVFDALRDYRREREAETNIAELFLVTLVSITEATKKYRAGETPENFVEIVCALSLVREAINDERLFSEPEMTYMTAERLRRYAVKANKIEAELVEYTGRRH